MVMIEHQAQTRESAQPTLEGPFVQIRHLPFSFVHSHICSNSSLVRLMIHSTIRATGRLSLLPFSFVCLLPVRAASAGSNSKLRAKRRGLAASSCHSTSVCVPVCICIMRHFAS